MTESNSSSPSGFGSFREQVQVFAAALSFMTRLPLPSIKHNSGLLGRSVIYFPAVGLLVGLLGALAFILGDTFWNQTIAVALSMLATIVVTGGFHEDGLADTADGMGGGWTTEDKLSIMKDSRIGTYGLLALVMGLLLKFLALASVPAYALPALLVCGHVLGRWSTLPLLRYCEYLGGDSGTGNAFIGSVDDRRLLLGTVMAWLLVLICAPVAAVGTIVCAVVFTLACRYWFQAKLGGITGDTLGAANQLVELGVYLVAAACLIP